MCFQYHLFIIFAKIILNKFIVLKIILNRKLIMVIPSICFPYDPRYSTALPASFFVPLTERKSESKQKEPKQEDTLETLHISLSETMEKTCSFLDSALAFIQNERLKGRPKIASCALLETEQCLIYSQKVLLGIHNRIITYIFTHSKGLTTLSNEFERIFLTSQIQQKKLEVIRTIIIMERETIQPHRERLIQGLSRPS